MQGKQAEIRSKNGERTLLVALLLSAPGPAIISYAALTSGSSAQLADFIRRTAELAATFIAWLVYRRLRKCALADAEYTARMERLTSATVGAAMGLSGVALIVVGILRLLASGQSEKTPLGLAIAFLGLVVNIWFWQKYRAMNRSQPDPVIAAQQRLYRGKASVDLCIVAALAAVTIAPSFLITKYIDAFSSIAVAGYLLYNGADVFNKLRSSNRSV